MGPCDDGWGDCDADLENGCEEQLLTNPDNCGACGLTCAFAHAAASCVAGTCAMGSCFVNFADCDEDRENGCEIDLTGDAANCGACGAACALAQASAACVDGSCAIDACFEDFADCDSNPETGCEVDLNADPANCGICGNVCDFDNASASCLEGACTIGACFDGFADCDADPATGCEADLDTDATDCGSCDTACAAFEICVDAACLCPDADSDGHRDAACGGSDCDDGAADVNPGSAEICGDGIDQDCDGQDPECPCPDADDDGFEDHECGGADCDDGDATVNPDADDVCGDGIDQDCDGEDPECDETDSGCGCGASGNAGSPIFLISLAGLLLFPGRRRRVRQAIFRA